MSKPQYLGSLLTRADGILPNMLLIQGLNNFNLVRVVRKQIFNRVTKLVLQEMDATVNNAAGFYT